MVFDVLTYCTNNASKVESSMNKIEHQHPIERGKEDFVRKRSVVIQNDMSNKDLFIHVKSSPFLNNENLRLRMRYLDLNLFHY